MRDYFVGGTKLMFVVSDCGAGNRTEDLVHAGHVITHPATPSAEK